MSDEEEKLMISVDAAALKQVLVALNGPGHFIRELQHTRTPPVGDDNPINILTDQFNAWARANRKLME